MAEWKCALIASSFTQSLPLSVLITLSYAAGQCIAHISISTSFVKVKGKMYFSLFLHSKKDCQSITVFEIKY